MNTEQYYIHELNKRRVELEDYYDACAVMNLDKHDNLAGAIQELMSELSKYRNVYDDGK